MGQPGLPTLLTALEVADLLRVSRQTVYRWCSEKKLAGTKVAGTIRFRRSDVEALFDAETVAS